MERDICGCYIEASFHISGRGKEEGGGGGGRWGEDDQNMSIENPEKENEYIRHNFLRTSEQGGHSPSQHRRLQAWRSQSLNL